MEEKKQRISTVTRGSAIALLSLSALATFSPSASAAGHSFTGNGAMPNPVVQQSRTVKGVVTDKNGDAVIGANVVVKGTTLGNITDFDGNFVIENVPADAILEISYIGFKTQEISVAGKSSLQITLLEDSEALDEVIVVGYGSSVKKDLTTAVTSVKSKDFLQGAVNDPMQMVDGKVAGVTVNSSAAADPNTSSTIQVRGASSLKAGNSPLIVIDGMPGGDLRNIAQQDIESITVLKDGSAAAIYGSRGANGVILVQTKQGKAGKSTISYDGYVEHDFVASKPQVLDPESYLEKVTGANDYGYRTDWYDALLNKDNFGHNHNIALSGGSENTIFRLSTNFKQKEGIDISTKRKEYGMRGNFKHTTLEGLLEVGGNFSYRVADEDYTDYSSFKQAVQLNPTFSVDEMDAFRGSDYSYNPVKNLTERDYGAKQTYSTIDLSVKLNILKNLNTELKLGRQGHGKKMQDYKFATHRECINNDYKGRAEIKQEDWTDWTLEWLGNYSFAIDKHDFKIMAGYSYQEFNYESFNVDNRNFPTDAFMTNNLDAGDYMRKVAGRLGMGSYKSQEKTIAFLGRVNYNYNDLILFTGSLRQEGNTKFGDDHKWGLFPAASAAVRLSKLPVFENSGLVDDLKVRFSYGVTGRSGFDRYISLAKYSGFGRYWSDNSNSWIMGYGPGNNPNKDLSWEKQISYNLGIDYTLFDSRFSGSVDVFVREGKDVIGDYSVPLPPYLHSTIVANVGTTTSKGFEFQGSWDAVRTEDFSYTTNMTLSYTKSKLKSFSNEKYQLGYIEGAGFPSPGNPGSAQRLEDGKEIGSFYGFRYAGVDDAGNILIWAEGQEGGTTKLGSDGNEKDKVYLEGTGVPKWELAWGNTFVYKDFDFSLFFRGRFRYKIMNQYEMYYGLQVIAGDNKLTSAYEENAHIKGAKVICDYFLQNGNYLRLDNITVGWTPKIKSKWISNFRLYGTLKNVFTLTKYTGVDPTTVSTSGLWPGIGGMDVYPTTRNLTFGVQISY
ncbi:MAG: SusC/RagA family TonB-linked outer membrane protein [Parabacteroides sp.]